MKPSRLFLALLTLALVSGCAALQPAAPPLAPSELETILERMDAQRDRVTTFYALGTVTMKKWLVESEEANILVVGNRHPLRLKVEITHSWGAPVLHVLVDRGRMKAFSFPENTLYTGPATPEVLGRFLPSPPDLETVWALLRGYPALAGSGRATPEGGRRIACLEECPGSPWALEVLPVTLEPARLDFLGSRLEVVFDDVRAIEGIRFAGTVTYHPGDRGGQVRIRNERMVFNQMIPEKIYTLRTPVAYRKVALDEESP